MESARFVNLRHVHSCKSVYTTLHRIVSEGGVSCFFSLLVVPQQVFNLDLTSRRVPVAYSRQLPSFISFPPFDLFVSLKLSTYGHRLLLDFQAFLITALLRSREVPAFPSVSKFSRRAGSSALNGSLKALMEMRPPELDDDEGNGGYF